jgi:hypothetical protein
MADRRNESMIEWLDIQLDTLSPEDKTTAISGDLLSAVISTRYIFGFRKDNPNVFNSLIQSCPHF